MNGTILSPSDTPLDIIVKLSVGNPGATTVLADGFLLAPVFDPDAGEWAGFPFLLDFDDMGIYGSDIWVLYKYVCGQSREDLSTLLRARQLGFISKEEILNLIDHRTPIDAKVYLDKIREIATNFLLLEKEAGNEKTKETPAGGIEVPAA